MDPEEAMKKYLEAQGSRYSPPTAPESPAAQAVAPGQSAQASMVSPASQLAAAPPPPAAEGSGWGTASAPNLGAMMPPAGAAAMQQYTMAKDAPDRPPNPNTWLKPTKSVAEQMDGLQDYINRVGGAGGSNGRYVQNEDGMTGSFVGGETAPQAQSRLMSQYMALDKMDDGNADRGLKAYLGVGQLADQSRMSGVAERNASVNEGQLKEMQLKGSDERSKDTKRSTLIGGMLAMGKTIPEVRNAASAWDRLDRRSAMGGGLGPNGQPQGNGLSGLTVGPGGQILPPGQNKPGVGGHADETDVERRETAFGTDPHAAANASKTADEAMAALHRGMGNQKFAENLPEIRKYIGTRFGPNSFENYVNPGPIGMAGRRAMNAGIPNERDVLASMIRNHQIENGTPEEKRKAQKTKDSGRYESKGPIESIMKYFSGAP